MSYHAGSLMITRNRKDAKEVLEIPEILLTTAGRELFQLTQCTWNMEYLQAFSNFLKSKGCQLFYLEGVVALPDGRLRYTNPCSDRAATPVA